MHPRPSWLTCCPRGAAWPQLDARLAVRRQPQLPRLQVHQSVELGVLVLPPGYRLVLEALQVHHEHRGQTPHAVTHHVADGGRATLLTRLLDLFVLQQAAAGREEEGYEGYVEQPGISMRFGLLCV